MIQMPCHCHAIRYREETPALPSTLGKRGARPAQGLELPVDTSCTGVLHYTMPCAIRLMPYLKRRGKVMGSLHSTQRAGKAGLAN